MMPTADGWAVTLALARGLAAAGLIGGFGATLFRVTISGATSRRLVWYGLAAAAGFGGLWAVLQADDIAGAITPHALAMVATRTRFGRLVLARLLAIGLAAAAFALRQERLASVSAGVALALEAGDSHIAALYGLASWRAGAAALHLLAAGAWLGALPSLLAVVRHAPSDVAARAARRFSPLGVVCVVGLIATATVPFLVLIGGVSGLVDTEYGRVACLKIALLLTLTGLAWRNRRYLTPALAGSEPAPATRALGRAIAVELALGLLTVLAAGWLSTLAPAMPGM